MISVPCTHCHEVLTIDEAFAGGVCRCRHCGAIQTVPAHLKAGAAKTAGTPAKVLYRNPLRDNSQAGNGVPDAGNQTKIPSKTGIKRAAAPITAGGHGHEPLTWRAWALLVAVAVAGLILIGLLLTRT